MVSENDAYEHRPVSWLAVAAVSIVTIYLLLTFRFRFNIFSNLWIYPLPIVTILLAAAGIFESITKKKHGILLAIFAFLLAALSMWCLIAIKIGIENFS